MRRSNDFSNAREKLRGRESTKESKRKSLGFTLLPNLKRDCSMLLQVLPRWLEFCLVARSCETVENDRDTMGFQLRDLTEPLMILIRRIWAGFLISRLHERISHHNDIFGIRVLR